MEDDIISKLPDSLITHILSLLPTKDAVCTSVLSKRWIESWTLITKLDLDDFVFYYRNLNRKRKKSGGNHHFINFVNRALLLTKSNSVESLSLVIRDKYDLTLLNTWISCILKKRVKMLFVSSNLELFSALTSHTLFNCTYHLEELVLKMRHCAIKVPPSRFGFFTFGSLEVLKLCGIIFTIDEPLRIILGALKKFETKNCSWLSSNDVTIEAPLLESVLIEQNRESRSCTIKFSASCMKEFTYCGYGGMSQPIVLSNPSAARNASANIILNRNEYETNVQETGSNACLLLKQFSQVKCIKFQGSEVLTQSNMTVLPKFAMLRHLDLGFVSGEVLLNLLQKTPVLTTLNFKGISKFNQDLLNSAVVPNCMASTLQVVKFGTVHGSDHELFLAKFVMENGVVLERISFFLYDGRRKSTVIEEFKEKLYSFKKGVSFAILEFYS